MAKQQSQGFDLVYKLKKWTVVDGQRSGPGSGTVATRNALKFLKGLIERYRIRTVLDVSCGDMHWQPELLRAAPALRFIGCDVSPRVIASNKAKFPDLEFHCLDTSQLGLQLPQADLVICRHTLMHLQQGPARRLLENCLRAGRYICTTTHPLVKANAPDAERVPIVPGDAFAFKWRQTNLALAPFSLPPPLAYTQDANAEEWLALYEAGDLGLISKQCQ